MPASPAFDQDVFVNAVGGVKISEPAADLAVLLAIVSSLRNRPLPPKLVVFGEVGLAGEVRPVQRGQERLREAAKLGFTQALIPRANLPRTPIEGHRGDRCGPGGGSDCARERALVLQPLRPSPEPQRAQRRRGEKEL